jgi:hypothetical protein
MELNDGSSVIWTNAQQKVPDNERSTYLPGTYCMIRYLKALYAHPTQHREVVF